MTRRDLIQEISQRTGLSRTDASAALEALLEALQEALQRGEEVQLRRFGRFSLRYQRARKGRLIAAKKEILVPPRLKIYFTPSAMLTKAIAHNPSLLKRFEPK